jgi:hypothetical protein
MSLNRLANYFVLTLDRQSFYYKLVDVKDKTISTEDIVKRVVAIAKEILRGLLKKFVLLVINACPRNIKAFEILFN